MNATSENIAFKDDFTDILNERRKTSDFVWASREWDPIVAYRQPFHLDGSGIKSIVLNSPYLKYIINKIHMEQQMPISKIYRNAEAILDEIGFYRHLTVIRWFGLFISKLLKNLYSAIYVNEMKFLKIKSEMGVNPVLFVPSHKSYCDFVLMAFICFHYDVDIPRIAAGMDFLSMAGFGHLLRNACAFFLRRSFGNDELYSTIFSQYVQTLITNGDGPVEFFIEGTRSRTSKALFPKFGFLSMALKPFFFGLVPDITVVPVTLNYDKILEELLFAYELLGIPKPKESTKGFIKALGFLKENHGNVYVKFGNPISVKDFFSSNIDRSIHGSGSVHLQELSSQENQQILNLAHHIVLQQRELVILNSFNIIALVLNIFIINSSSPINVDKLIEEVSWLFPILRILFPEPSGFTICDVTKEDILKHLILHKPLINLSSDNKVKLGKVFLRNNEVDSVQFKGCELATTTLELALPIVMLQNYANPCSYIIIPVSFMALITKKISDNSFLTADEFFKEFKFLCSIFSYEFVIQESMIQKIYDKALMFSQYLNVIDFIQGIVKKGNNEKLHFYCISSLQPFIPAYRIVAETLLKSIISLTDKELLKLSQKNVECELINKMDIHPNNLSLDVLKNATQAYVSMKAVFKVKGNTIKYKVCHHQLEEIHIKLSAYEALTKIDFYKEFCQQFSSFNKSKI